MIVKNKLLEYLRLFRFHSVSSEVIILLVGALIMGQRDLFLLFIIFLIGIFAHIWGYILNDYADVEVDKKSSYLQKKPLVSGSISKKNALLVAIIAAIITFALTIIFFPSIYSILLLSLATILTIIYDFFGKKIPHFSDSIVAGALFFFCLFGASTVSNDFTYVLYIVCLLFFVDIIFINGIEGGLKDVDHDSLAGAKTLAIITGVRVNGENLSITRKFSTIAYSLMAIFIGMIILLSFQPEIDLWRSGNYIIQVIIVLLAIVTVFISYKLLNLSTFDRSKIKKLIAGHSAASGALIFTMLLPIVGIWIAVFLLLFPVIWYTVFNYILFGKPLQPQI